MRQLTIYILSFIIIAIGSCSVSKGDVYVLPNDYVGIVIIIYNQKNTYKPIEIKGKRVFHIPESGVLKTDASLNYEWKNSDEVFYGNNTNGKKIPIVRDPVNYKKDQINATLASSGTTKDSNGDEIEFSVFYVGNKSQISTFANTFKRRTNLEW